MKKLTLCSLAILLTCHTVAEDVIGDSPARRFQGVSTNDVVAFADYQSAGRNELTEALGIERWDFQVQVPDGTETLIVRFDLAEGHTYRKLGELTLLPSEREQQSGGRVPGQKRFRVTVFLLPTDSSVTRPLIENSKLRVHVKESLSGSSGGTIIKNPFRKGGGVTVFHSANVVREGNSAHGVWDGYGTQFGLMERDSKRVQVSFAVGSWYYGNP